MLVAQALVVFKYLNCPRLLDSDNVFALIMAIITTLMAIVSTCAMIYLKSSALDEPPIKYVLQSMQAQQGWMPFMQFINDRSLNFSIDFNSIESEFPLLTDVLGYYFTLDY